MVFRAHRHGLGQIARGAWCNIRGNGRSKIAGVKSLGRFAWPVPYASQVFSGRFFVQTFTSQHWAGNFSIARSGKNPSAKVLYLDEQERAKKADLREFFLDMVGCLKKGGAMGYAAERIPMTEEEYLAFERASDERHEFANGEVFAMAGGTYEHALIAGNIIRELGLGLRGRRCTVQTSDMRTNIQASKRYVYPDVSVVCGRPQFKDETHDTLLNPRVIVEVLSPSTEEYDRGEKFVHYQTLPSLAHYVLAAQDKPCIEVFTRLDDGSWNSQTYGPGDRVELKAIECVIEVNQVYSNVFDSDYDDEPVRIDM